MPEKKAIKHSWVQVEKIYGKNFYYQLNLVMLVIELSFDEKNADKEKILEFLNKKYSLNEPIAQTSHELSNLCCIILKELPIMPAAAFCCPNPNKNLEFPAPKDDAAAFDLNLKNAMFSSETKPRSDTLSISSYSLAHHPSQRIPLKNELFYCGALMILGGGVSMLVGSANQQWKFKMGVENMDELFVTIGFSIVGITVLCLVGYFIYKNHCDNPSDEQEVLIV